MNGAIKKFITACVDVLYNPLYILDAHSYPSTLEKLRYERIQKFFVEERVCAFNIVVIGLPKSMNPILLYCQVDS